MAEAKASNDRNRLFAQGIARPLEEIRRLDVFDIVKIHKIAAKKAIAALVREGFSTSEQVRAVDSDSLGNYLSLLAPEAAAFVTEHEERLNLQAETAADLLCALAIVYDSIPRGPYPNSDAVADAMARLAAASQMVGLYEGMLSMAQLGYFDDAALRRFRDENARRSGEASAQLRKVKSAEWQDRAREAWRTYKGGLSRSAWSRRHCSEFGVKPRALYGAIKEIKNNVPSLPRD
ncbi:MAG: hypothetical protein AB7I34_26100 [Rhizobiaceae bacterium]